MSYSRSNFIRLAVENSATLYFGAQSAYKGTGKTLSDTIPRYFLYNHQVLGMLNVMSRVL